MEEELPEDPREQLSDLSQLVRSRGWARLRSIAEAQARTRTANVLGPRKDDNIWEQEYQKGEIAGIRLFMQLPEVAIANLQQQIKDEEKDETEDE